MNTLIPGKCDPHAVFVMEINKVDKKETLVYKERFYVIIMQRHQRSSKGMQLGKKTDKYSSKYFYKRRIKKDIKHDAKISDKTASMSGDHQHALKQTQVGKTESIVLPST